MFTLGQRRVAGRVPAVAAASADGRLRRGLTIDAYDRIARLGPALIVALPISLLLTPLAVTVGPLALGAPAIVLVLSFLTTEIVRDAGTHVQTRLWRTWDGPPSTGLLRWSSAPDDVIAHRHDVVSRATSVPLPTAAEQAADPAGADRRYERAGDTLRELTRDAERFPAVSREVLRYGFRRNLLGVRRWALATGTVGLVGLGAFIALGEADTRRVAATGAVVTAALTMLIWRLVRDAWVRRAADRYAERLIDAAATLSRG